MATIKNTISLQDKMTPILRTIIQSLQGTVLQMASVDSASNQAFKTVQKDAQKADETINNLNNNLDNIPESVQKGASAFSKLQANVIAINQAWELGKKAVGAIVNKMTQISAMTDQQSRLKAILSEGEDIYEMQKKITRSAMGTRSAYKTTLESAVQLKSAMEEYGVNTDAAIRMSELMNKALTLGGTKGSAADSVMYNLQQSLAGGKLRWEDWKIVASNSVYLADVVAKNVGVSRAQLNVLVQEGKISAADFTDALLAAGQRIDAEFQNMPDTFVDWMTNIKTFFVGEFLKTGGLHDKIMGVLSSDKFLAAVDAIKSGLIGIFNLIEKIFNVIAVVGEFVTKNWGMIEPLIIGIAGAFLIFNTHLIATSIASKLSIANLQKLWATLLANPFALVAVAVGAIIALIYKWIKSVGGIQNAWEIAQSAILVASQALKIGFFTSIFAILGLIDNLKYAWSIASVAISNFLGDLKVNVLEILQNMINGAIDLINKFINTVNKIPGVNIGLVSKLSFASTAAVENEANRQARAGDLDRQSAWMQQLHKEREEDLQAMKDEMKVLTSNLDSVYANSKSDALRKAENIAGDMTLDEYSANDAYYQKMINAAGNPTIAGGQLDSIKDAITITDEDIKLLKDVAKTEFINQYTSLKPEMKVTFGDIRETADVGQIMNVIETMVTDAYASVLGGV